jgi:hypothetical protein
MNLYGLSAAAANEHVRDLRRTACDEREARSVQCRESGWARAARRVGGLTKRGTRA